MEMINFTYIMQLNNVLKTFNNKFIYTFVDSQIIWAGTYFIFNNLSSLLDNPKDEPFQSLI